MTYASRIVVLCAAFGGACGGTAGGQGTSQPQPDPYGYESSTPEASPQPQPPPATQPTAVTAAPPENKPNDPVRERAGQLREAADLLDKAAAAREREAKSFADQLFSSAELILGPEAVAELAPLFREGAPPRVTTPPKKVPRDQPPQPLAEGESDKDRPEPPRPRKGTLTGAITLDGKGDLGVITLQPVGRKSLPPIPTARVMEQRGRKFAPRVLVVPTGSVVAFPNFDPFFHNVFSTSQTKPFDLGLYRTNEAREIQFDSEGTVRVGCNLHANMSAFIVVVSAPHYTVTDPSGRFTFKSLEPGKYVLRAYSERSSKPTTQDVTIEAGKNEVTVGAEADAPSGPMPDKFGAPRGGKSSP